MAANAQVTQVERYEIHLREGQSEPYKIVGLHEEGLLLYSPAIADGKDVIEVFKLDTTMQEKWRGFVQLEGNLNLVHSQSTARNIFFLLKDRYQPTADFTIISVSIANGSYTTFSVKNKIPFNPTHFVITNDAALIGGYFNYRPLVVHYNFKKGVSAILPGFFNEPGEINQIRETAPGNFDIVVSTRNLNKRKCLWIRSFNTEGELTKTIILQPDEDKNLIFGKSVQTMGGEQIVSGVYGRYTDYSRGIFIARIDELGEYTMNYYNFAELKNFFKYLKVKREARIKNRIERRRVKGRKNRFNYRIMVDELIPYGDKFIMLGEAFYPHYSYSTSSINQAIISSRFYGTPLTRNDLIFNGYQYTHAVVIGFDQTGNLIWDNSFEINDVRTFTIEQYVKLMPQEDQLVLLYLFENVIRSKIIQDDNIVEGKTYNSLKMAFNDDLVQLKDTEKSRLDYWYQNVFFASGIQQVRNVRDFGIDIHRRVFFVNKIVYR